MATLNSSNINLVEHKAPISMDNSYHFFISRSMLTHISESSNAEKPGITCKYILTKKIRMLLIALGFIPPNR